MLVILLVNFKYVAHQPMTSTLLQVQREVTEAAIGVPISNTRKP